MIITFRDKTSTVHILASRIISMTRIPADSWPERTRLTTSDSVGFYLFEDTREDFERNLAAWREAVSPKPAGG